MSINGTLFTAGQCVVGYLLDESTAEEAQEMASLAYELAGMDPDDDEWAFNDFKYDVLEAELICNIEGAVEKAVNAMWEAVRNGKYNPKEGA